jgi:hypothetical protein
MTELDQFGIPTDFYISTHEITLTGSDTRYLFPQTLRDVMAIRVRDITSKGFFPAGLAIVNVLCSDFYSGYRWDSCSNGERLFYSIAQFPMNPISRVPPRQPKHILQNLKNIHQLNIRIVDETLTDILINPLDPPILIIDVWHKNIKPFYRC